MSAIFELSSDFIAESGIVLDRDELEYGLRMGYIKPQVAATLAQATSHNIGEIEDEQFNTDRNDHVGTQSDATQSVVRSSARKWLYLELKAAYLCRADLPDPLGVVEQIYSDFDYPASMDSFVRYMPLPPGGVATPEGVVERWRTFLVEEGRRLASREAPPRSRREG